MSDTVTKWHEMQEAKIYESPDNGETITERPFQGDINEKKEIKTANSKVEKQAYRILCDYSPEAIKLANKILSFESRR